MKAIIRLEVPEHQIGKEVSCYFKDTMSVKGICEKAESSEGHWIVRVVPGEHPFLAVRNYCSVCGDWQTHGAFKHCPNCGARMSGEVETE